MDSMQLVTLRTEVREIEARLKALEEFARGWEDYTTHLLQIVSRLDGKLTLPRDDRQLWEMLDTADDMRSTLRSRMATVLSGGVRHPMGTMLSMSLRSQTKNLVEEFLARTGRVVVNEFERAYSVRYALELLTDCKSILDEKKHELEAGLRRQKAMLEELERAGKEEHERELEKIRVQSPRCPKWIGKVRTFLSSAFESRIKGLVSSLIILALVTGLAWLFPGTRPYINRAIRFVTSHNVQDTIPVGRQ